MKTLPKKVHNFYDMLKRAKSELQWKLPDMKASEPTGFAASLPTCPAASFSGFCRAWAVPALLLGRPSAAWQEEQDRKSLSIKCIPRPELCCRPKTFWLQLCAILKMLAHEFHHFLSCCFSERPSQAKNISKCSVPVPDQKEWMNWRISMKWN